MEAEQNDTHCNEEANSKLAAWDSRIDGLADAAAERAHDAAAQALQRGVTPLELLEVANDAIGQFTIHHHKTAYGESPALYEEGARQMFDALYQSLRDGKIPRAAYRPIEVLLEHAQAVGPVFVGWPNGLYGSMSQWLVASEPTTPKLLECISEVADYFVQWEANDELVKGADHKAPCAPHIGAAADPFIDRINNVGRCPKCTQPVSQCDGGEDCQWFANSHANHAAVSAVEKAAEVVHDRAGAAMVQLYKGTLEETLAALRDGHVPKAPLVLVSEGVRALGRMRMAMGEPEGHVASDPLASLVLEISNSRLSKASVRAIRGLALAVAENSGEEGYNDGHERETGTYSVVSLLCDLADYAAMVVDDPDTNPNEWTVEGIKTAASIAEQLIRCQLDHALTLAPLDEAKTAELVHAADDFIAALAPSAP